SRPSGNACRARRHDLPRRRHHQRASSDTGNQSRRTGDWGAVLERRMNIRFLVDTETERPHIYDHGVTEDEVRQVLAKPGEDFRGRKRSRIALGQTAAGLYLQVVYAPDD